MLAIPSRHHRPERSASYSRRGGPLPATFRAYPECSHRRLLGAKGPFSFGRSACCHGKNPAPVRPDEVWAYQGHEQQLVFAAQAWTANHYKLGRWSSAVSPNRGTRPPEAPDREIPALGDNGSSDFCTRGSAKICGSCCQHMTPLLRCTERNGGRWRNRLSIDLPAMAQTANCLTQRMQSARPSVDLSAVGRGVDRRPDFQRNRRRTDHDTALSASRARGETQGS